MSGTATPTEIRYSKADRTLSVHFDDGAHFVLTAELLRVESPSAEVQGHGGEQKRIVGNKRDVAITAIEPVGNYAVRLIFDDGHDSGLYSWRVLYDLGRHADQKWADYLKALDAKGLSR